jgi:predicted lipoprotein with Yx(FWY)xxD motif
VKKIVLLLSLAAAVLAACGQAVSATSSRPSATVSPTTIAVANNPTFGQILTTSSGRSLYYFTPEQGGTVACTGSCTQFWTPVTVGASGIAATATLPGTLATITRPDGSRQVTYSEWPLYTFTGDKAPGDVNGQGIMGKWFVVTPQLTDQPIAVATPTPAPTPAPTLAPPPPARTAPPAPAPAPTNCIPGNNGGDHDGDNNGAPSDNDGCK